MFFSFFVITGDWLTNLILRGMVRSLHVCEVEDTIKTSLSESPVIFFAEITLINSCTFLF